VKFATVCSGVEACSVAWKSLGWTPVFFSEIEDFPSEVLNTHYPDVPNHGDMTNFEKWGYERGAVDVFCGGTPCQSFSIAGLGKGLGDERGNLALTYCRMVDQLRPKWFIWENVAGVLSSNGGRDFGSILGAMAKLGYVFGWRVLDAQYFGVPQRRRRIFLVGCSSGSIGDIRKVLFEPEGFAGDLRSCDEKKQNSATGIGNSSAFDLQAFGQYGNGSKASTVKARDYKDATDLVIYENNPSDARLKPLGDKSSTVIARWGTGGNNVPLVVHGTQDPIISDKAMPIQTNQGQENVLYGIKTAHTKANGWGVQENRTHTLDASGSTHAVYDSKSVRRLTPIEVERLQGFPDNHTNIPWNKKPNAPDSRRYKAMGNSMAVPVMQWLGRRIQKVEEGNNE
jgi:DNA (cytosine-5)-methyltransferase 1|tara:strand:- start:1538 stop:2728 length:1191 start_codon:yes stop_codon:yes gene_type:complete